MYKNSLKLSNEIMLSVIIQYAQDTKWAFPQLSVLIIYNVTFFHVNQQY